ncbi:MAG: CocE/NonD family hydrolase [Verrucomicrobia bacterium]|nr:CocE/NonD family hydrolase [Verrucomicrobiota bacterium]
MTEPTLARECRVVMVDHVPMRDGIRLATSVYLPRKSDRFPAVLVRTAYNRTGLYEPFSLQHGMALVTQDCRGRYDSDGVHEPFMNEKEDGFDTLEWIARQPWCNGRIGMVGDSHLAATQTVYHDRQRPSHIMRPIINS